MFTNRSGPFFTNPRCRKTRWLTNSIHPSTRVEVLIGFQLRKPQYLERRWEIANVGFINWHVCIASRNESTVSVRPIVKPVPGFTHPRIYAYRSEPLPTLLIFVVSVYEHGSWQPTSPILFHNPP